MTYRLSNSLPYLVTRAGIRARDLFNQVAKTHGLTVQSYRVLAALLEEGRPVRLGELAELTAIDLSTLSRTVADMHRNGLLIRDRPERDRRSLQVRLTPLGRTLVLRLTPVAARFEEVETTGLSQREITALKATLKQLYRNVDRLEEELMRKGMARTEAEPADEMQAKLAGLHDTTT
ncbi:MarR family winged helix-turn-helix transcriptional regulator [Methylovirgula sp. 4M-Z18]|uniref:MarR family winged helix-turn-helix transcriptional regulator n=1 Tax=Methylovirgula sp. 4M-Z18 TaxID=2293567 RepID=UPI000E2E7247|nr:MarR family transcriptional regulator [Methylovirgula sp. 4M-Z18]RFB77936.1 MarR family transcriptional regulator [Methylovirgula sp. 4M-Z18]